MPSLAIKIDVDTERGTRDGVLPLAEMCRRHGVPATFFFSVGPDNMGKSIYRLFQPGFLRKVVRTRVASNYGWRTLLNGTLRSAPHLGQRFGEVMRRVRELGFEAGIHCYDHYRWQNHLHAWTLEETRAEFGRAREEFQRIFGENAQTAGAPGWQCNERSLKVNDESGFLYASDTRGSEAFWPQISGHRFQTPQLPTTLPTLDELLGRAEFPLEKLIPYYLSRLREDREHVLTAHAELEGLRYATLFDELLGRAKNAGVRFDSLRARAHRLREAGRAPLPVCRIEQRAIEGRSGTLAVQAGS